MPTRPAVWTSRLTTPGAGAFAVLFGLQAFIRALVTVALSVQTMEIMGSDEGVSALFLVGSLAALAIAFVIPRLTEWMGRARLCSLAILVVAASAGLFILREPSTQVLGFVLRACGIAVLFAGTVEANQVQSVTIDGAGLPSGMYIVRVIGDRFSDALSVTLLK